MTNPNSQTQNYACQPLKDLYISITPGTWDYFPIILIDKGNCSYVEMARNVQRAGGYMALIINDKDGNVKDTGTIAGSTNMDAMQSAKDNTMFINEVKKLCEDVKICVIMINHLVEIPVLDRYNPPKPILPSMKYNQKLITIKRR